MDTSSDPVPASAQGGPVSHAIVRVARLHKMTAGRLLRRIGLHPNQELVMMRLWDAGPQRQADLAAVMESDSATITRTIQRLERAGFVRRVPGTDDRRVTIVEPTAASESLRPEVERVWRELEEVTLGTLGADEVAEALRVLGALEANLAEARRRVAAAGARAEEDARDAVDTAEQESALTAARRRRAIASLDEP